MLESSKETCHNPNHDSFFYGNGYHDRDKRRFPLLDINLTDEDTGITQNSTWCSLCLTVNALLDNVEELCSCGHHKYFHDLEVGEKQQDVKEDRRFNICEGGGARHIQLDPLSNEEVKYGRYCRCKNFKPTKLRLDIRSDSSSIPGQ